MIDALRNAFKIPDLRNRIVFTLLIIGFYRVGAYIPVPGVDIRALRELFNQPGLLGLLNLFAGGALGNFAVFALGIMPYITAAIIMQLLRVAIPKLEEWSKEGELGQQKITQWTRYLTLVLALFQSFGLILFFQSQLGTSFSLVTKFMIVVTLTAGTALIMWLGELITQKGIGNGMSILIFSSIIAGFPIGIVQTVEVTNPVVIIIVAAILLAVTVAIVTTEKAQRRIPVQYAKRVVGRKMYGGQSTYIPLKVNSAGVIPIIFAVSVLLFPQTLAQFFPAYYQTLTLWFRADSPLYLAALALLVVFFTYFYTAIIFNPADIADNIKKYGGFIPGVRPGRPTASHLDRILTRITLPGAVFLAAIAVLPSILLSALNVPFFQSFGGTSLLITVGVALETMRQLESQLVMRNYDGFLGK